MWCSYDVIKPLNKQIVEYSFLTTKILIIHNWKHNTYWLRFDVVGHLVHVLLIIYNSTEHVTQKSPGPKCGWVGRILHPDSCMSGSSWSKEPLWSIWSVAVPPWQPLPHCLSQWHGSLPQHGQWWRTYELYYSPLLWRLECVFQLWRSPPLSGAPSSSGLAWSSFLPVSPM